MFIDANNPAHNPTETPTAAAEQGAPKAPSAIDTFNVGDRFRLKSHKGCDYEVVGFWCGAKGLRHWMDVMELNGVHNASTSFCEINLEDFARRGEIVSRRSAITVEEQQ